jgi:tetratricopeptide (TPR) repeat protein
MADSMTAAPPASRPAAEPAAPSEPRFAALRRAPTTVPAFAALVLLIIWATSEAGFPVTHWAPGGLILLALLGIATAIVRVRWSEIAAPVRVALAALTAFTALSYLSILWAGVPGDAWEGANRTLVYLVVFALFACWRQQARTALALVAFWTLAMGVLAVYTALHLDAASASALPGLLPGGRLTYPSGYANANAAQWLMAFWPALLLARSPRLHPAARGVLAAAAVMLACVALLSQSRGSLYATPVMLVLVFALLPGRMRTLAVLLPVGAAIAGAASAVLRVGNHLRDGSVTTANLHHAVHVSLLVAVAAGLVVGIGAALAGRAHPSPAVARRLTLAARACVVVLLIGAVTGGLVAAGDPVARIRHGWHTFKGGYGADSKTGSRLVSGLGSNRYDFYRVSLDEFVDHPVAGIGADNFQQQYLAHRRSSETPHYPHSVELRTLADFGLIGALIAVVGLGAALLAGWRAVRAPDELAAAVAAAALGAFAYWAVHGSFDWFWEFAGLGAPAFAMLGVACSLAPVGVPAPGAGSGGDARSTRLPRLSSPLPRPLRVALIAAAAALALAAALSLATTWLSARQLQSAANVWRTSPQTAYARLRDAARLNPLSDAPYTLAGSIALRYSQLAYAERQFRLALGRTPDDSYATLELGAIASARGRRTEALARLQRAVQLDPRNPLARQALAVVRSGRTISVPALNQAILSEGRLVS